MKLFFNVSLFLSLALSLFLPPSLASASERKHRLSTEQFPVSAYVGSSKNLKDLQKMQSALL